MELFLDSPDCNPDCTVCCEIYDCYCVLGLLSIWINTLRPRQNGRHFADDIFKCIFLNENIWISIRISMKFVPEGPINNIPALVQIMAWRRPGDKPLSEAMMVNLPTHICVSRPQWVKATLSESWWRYAMEVLSALLAFCRGNPQVTSGFPLRKVSNMKFSCFLWYLLE